MDLNNYYIRNEKITDLFEVTPDDFTIHKTSENTHCPVTVENISKYYVAWRVRVRPRGRVKREMVTKKIIAPGETVDCNCYVSDCLDADVNKPEKFQIIGTALEKMLSNEDLEEEFRKRDKIQNKKNKIFAYQEVTIKCHFVEEILPDPQLEQSHFEFEKQAREFEDLKAQNAQQSKLLEVLKVQETDLMGLLKNLQKNTSQSEKPEFVSNTLPEWFLKDEVLSTEEVPHISCSAILSTLIFAVFCFNVGQMFPLW